MKIREIAVKTILTRTRIGGYDFCINPYVGCGHGCTYCYARFMKRFTGHEEPWGRFVDVKVNAASVLARQLRRVTGGSVLVGTVTDPYQPLERRYGITRGCLEALKGAPLCINLLTRSPLCIRDIDLFRSLGDIEVGLTVTTDKEEIRRIFEPSAPPVPQRIEALRVLHGAGVRTYVFIGPVLPMDPGRLVEELAGAVDEVLVDRLNYPARMKPVYRRAGMARYMEDGYFTDTAGLLREGFGRAGIAVSVLF